MLSIALTSGSTQSGTAVSFKNTLNTNNNLIIDGSSIKILIPGIYEIVGTATVTSTAGGNYGLGIYANDELQGNASVSLATGASETTTTPLYGLVSVEETPISGYATINIMPVGTPTIVGGVVSIKKIS